MGKRRFPLVLTAVLFAVLGFGATPSAHATTPGKNGHILFSGTKDVFAFDPNGSGVQTILRGANASNAQWSPNGTEFLYQHFEVGTWRSNLEIFNVAANTSRLLRGLGFGRNFEGSWSPDGNQILFEESQTDRNFYFRSGPFTMSADGSNVHSLPIPSDIDVDEETPLSPAQSPNGKKIAFEAEDAFSDELELHVMNSDGTDDQDLGALGVFGEHGIGQTAPSWSPDSSKLLVNFLVPSVGHSHLGMVDVDSGDFVDLDPGSIEDDFAPVISPDGKQIAFVSNRSGLNDLYISDLIESNGKTGIRSAWPVFRAPSQEQAPTWDLSWQSFPTTGTPSAAAARSRLLRPVLAKNQIPFNKPSTPRITNFRVAPAMFRQNKPAKVTFNLTEPVKLTLKLKRGGKVIGTITRNRLPSGSIKFMLKGIRSSGHAVKLKPGLYNAVLIATSPRGKRSKPANFFFKVQR